jgi:hypothetical protein
LFCARLWLDHLAQGAKVVRIPRSEIEKLAYQAQSEGILKQGSKIHLSPPEKTSSEQGEVFSYPSRRLGISSDFSLYLITEGAYHHALACISLRLDDIQHFVLVIYKTAF